LAIKKSFQILLPVLAVVVFAALIVFIVTGQAEGSGRTVSVQAEGRIDIKSNVSAGEGEAASRVHGTGTLEYGNQIQGGSTGNLDADYYMKADSGPEELRPIRSTVAFRSPEFGIYALQVQGQDTEIAARGDLTAARFNIEAMARLQGPLDPFEAGTFRTYLDIVNPETGLTIREAMKIRGRVHYIDFIDFERMDFD